MVTNCVPGPNRTAKLYEFVRIEVKKIKSWLDSRPRPWQRADTSWLSYFGAHLAAQVAAQLSALFVGTLCANGTVHKKLEPTCNLPSRTLFDFCQI